MVSVSAEQPVSAPLLRMSWETLSFVHWRVAPERVQDLLPSGLEVDVYDGSAWVGLTPFVMANIRPLGLGLRRGAVVPGPTRPTRPAWMAGLTSTPETNLRTYVRGPDGRDGLWFLSIDAGSGALSAAIRAAVGAPYHRAQAAVRRDGDTITYDGSRSGAREAYRLQVRAGGEIAPSELEIWVTSRWRAYTRHLGRLLVTPVEHEPWPLRAARIPWLDQNLTDSVGLAGLGEPALVHYSDGVQDVRLGRPALVG